MLPRRDLLLGCRHPVQLNPVVETAETALRTWEPCWTAFLDGAVREEACERLGNLAELELHGDGGYPGAERQRLLILRRETGLNPVSIDTPLTGVQINGNFLFDPAEPEDLRLVLVEAGLQVGAIGDVWLRGDRGGQAVVSSEASAHLDGWRGQVRTVEVHLEVCPLSSLQPPARRLPRRLQTVEASCRLDAVASAGFGLSRNRMGELIRAGQVRVNWKPITSSSHPLSQGDRIHLQDRGEVEVEGITITKRDRWRLELLRR